MVRQPCTMTALLLLKKVLPEDFHHLFALSKLDRAQPTRGNWHCDGEATCATSSGQLNPHSSNTQTVSCFIFRKT